MSGTLIVTFNGPLTRYREGIPPTNKTQVWEGLSIRRCRFVVKSRGGGYLTLEKPPGRHTPDSTFSSTIEVPNPRSEFTLTSVQMTRTPFPFWLRV